MDVSFAAFDYMIYLHCRGHMVSPAVDPNPETVHFSFCVLSADTMGFELLKAVNVC
jgi:hypothetical protein